MAATADYATERSGSFGDTEPARRPPIPVPSRVALDIDRGRAEMLRDAAKRRLCIRFERGESWWWVDERSRLNLTPYITSSAGGGKPPHKVRNQYNFIRPIIEDKVSAATQRIPSYEIDPSTTDPEDAGAAKMSEKIAIYGYDQWRMRKTAIDATKTAIAHGGASYTLPYWEPNVGPYVQVGGRWVGQGDVRFLVFNGNEVYWEAGVDFDRSRWWVVERARMIDELYTLPGYCGGELAGDATTSDIPTDRNRNDRLAMTREYFERPCPKWPYGRWMTIANGRVIVDARLIDEPGDGTDAPPVSDTYWQEYPLKDADGTILDEPLIHRLVYTHDPDDDDDLGLVWQLIDFQRAAQDCVNKMLEYKNRGLNLQMMAPVNSIISPPDDIPNSVRYYKLSPNGEKPEWENPPSGQILNALQQIFNLVIDQMNRVASYEDITAGSNVAARTAQAAIEQSNARWQSFLGDLADWHSRVMRHALMLVARYYTEPRTVAIRGRMGWESIPDFKGAHLMGQTNVRVFSQSLEYLTKTQIMARVQYYAQMQWITGEQAMAAIEGGIAEKLVEGYEQDVAKVNRIIAKIRDGSVMEQPTRMELIEVPGQPQLDPATGAAILDPTTGQPATGPPRQQMLEVPVWMPSDWDNIPVWRQQLGNWMKTIDFEQTPPKGQEVAKLMWGGLDKKETEKAAKQAAQQQKLAQALGMGNAAAPQGAPALPSTPNAAGLPASGANTPGTGPGDGSRAGGG